MSIASPKSTGNDRASLALGLTLFALALSYAINLKTGLYARQPLIWLTISIVLCLVTIALPQWPALEWLSGKILAFLLAIGIAIQTFLLASFDPQPETQIVMGTIVIGLLCLAQVFHLRGLRIALIAVAAAAFVAVGSMEFNKTEKHTGVDVFMFQGRASYALLHGQNPYSYQYPNVYGDINTPYYSRAVLDSTGMFLTYGFPYPPLSLLMVIPGYWAGDVRYADAVEMALAVVLMALARPGRAGRISALAAAMFLLTPQVFYLLGYAYTEAPLVLTLSLAMLCACRWPRAMPYALGLFFSTKQYTVLALPLLPLLMEGPHPWRQLRSTISRAGLVVAAFNLPFLFWNINAFTRAIVEFQLVQPFRHDALSYLVFFYKHFHGLLLPIWTPLLVIVPVYALSLWRCPRSPAGFAAALTLVDLIFFAFNKQAFCNYYYFVIATACWSIAAMRLPQVEPKLVVPTQPRLAVEP